MGGASLLGEAELHGLVDGHLEADRRADVLRKLAASPADRALIEAWQEQNDLIRAAFRDVERETLPVALDLAPPRLRCIDGSLDQPKTLPPIYTPARVPPAARPREALVTAATLLVVAVGLAGAWLMIGQGTTGQGNREDDAAGATAGATASSPPALEATLAERAASALERGGSAADAPAVHVPDLAAAGLRLIDVSTQPGAPGALVLRYRDAGDGRVVLGIAGAPDASTTQATAVGRTISWRRGGSAYALAGTVPPDRLRRLAQALQNEQGKD